VPQHGRCGPTHRGQTDKGCCDAVAQSLTAYAGFANRARAGTNGLRCRDLERLFSSERRAQRDCQEAQRRNEPGNGHAGRMHELGVTGVALERRSPEYLAKFVVDEIARWAGPIKANGLQVD